MDGQAPGYVRAAYALPWIRRGFSQGAGYMFPTLGFLLIPIWSLRDTPYLPVTIALAVIIGALAISTSWVLHIGEAGRWLWLLALILAIVTLGIVTDGEARPAYFAAFPAAVAAQLLPWPEARLVIVVLALIAGGYSFIGRDWFGVVLAVTAATVGLTIGASLEANHARTRLALAEERTAVLAVAAERERIGRDLHDILGHSLTTIAIKADLASRLIGRDDAAASQEVRQIADVARQSLADVRATASGMREVRLASEIAAARSVLVAAGVETDTPVNLPALADEASELFGYVVREAVTNVVRHADANRCEITCTEDCVSIIDDGRGLGDRGEGSGLGGLRARAENAGADLLVSSSAEGTVVLATLREAP